MLEPKVYTALDLFKIETAYNDSQLQRAPIDAQKNSDITKAEIEAKLTGEISTHSHDLSSKLNTTAFSGLTKITVGSTPPSNPSVGDLYIDTN
jgi:hypothetical protein